MTIPATLTSGWLIALAPAVAIVAVIVGWSLNELSFHLRVRLEDRRSIGRALSELMEIRHELIALPKIMEVVRTKIPIPSEAGPQIRQALESLLPYSEGLEKRYDAAVTSVSGAFPMLAFELRSKDALRPFLARMRVLLQSDAEAQLFWSKMEDRIVRHLTPALDRLILRLARRRGLRTWWDARSRLRGVFDMPNDFDDFFSEIAAKMQEAAQAEAAKVARDSSPVSAS